MFFEHVNHQGYECRDGGLKENNPLQLAVNESKKIWESITDFDVILSIGSGRATHPQQKPASWKLLPQWLVDLFNTLISTMDGEDAWRRFSEGQEDRITSRASRLNVKFKSSYEPALDDCTQIRLMEELAKSSNFHHKPSPGPFSPITGRPGSNQLDLLADRLRASLFFFNLVSVTKHLEIYSVTGWIGCRLEPTQDALRTLLGRTKSFHVKGREYAVPNTANGGQYFRLDVDFAEQSLGTPIRIDVNFGLSHAVSISGFPMTLQVSAPFAQKISEAV